MLMEVGGCCWGSGSFAVFSYVLVISGVFFFIWFRFILG